jgi:hypothetical protein
MDVAVRSDHTWYDTENPAFLGGVFCWAFAKQKGGRSPLYAFILPMTVVVPVVAMPMMVAPTPVPVVPVMMVPTAMPTYLLRLDMIDVVLRHDGRLNAHADSHRCFYYRRHWRSLCGRREHHAARKNPHREF